MSRTAVLGLLVPSLVILHFLLHVGFSLGGIAPDLLTLALLLAVRETGSGAGGALGFALGLLEDAFSIRAFGANVLALTVLGILGARTRDFFVGDSSLFFFAYLGLGKVLRDLVFWVAAGEDVGGSFVNAVLLDGVLGGVYVAVVGLLLVQLLGGSRELR